MKKIKVRIREIDKGDKDLTLLNLREELVNFLYRDTVANSTKSDLLFYVLLFFVFCRKKDESLLDVVMKEGISKLEKLNAEFAKKNNRIRPGVYRRFVEEQKLGKLFAHDVFFVIIEAILNIDEINAKYADYISKNKYLSREMTHIRDGYFMRVVTLFKNFQASEIIDERHGEYGNTLDLSKSVYRTIRMRNSRNLDLNLQKYTSVCSVTSKSPVDFSFFQCVPPEMVFDLWDKFHLASYAKSLLGDTFVNVRDHVDMRIGLGDAITIWIGWRSMPASAATQKRERKEQFDAFINDPEIRESLTELGETMVKSILESDERRKKEIEKLKKQKQLVQQRRTDLKESEEVKKLKARIAALENIVFEAEELEDGESD